MSTATLQPSQQNTPPRSASAQGHKQYLRPSNPQNARSASNPQPTRQQEKALVLNYADAAKAKEVLPPEDVSKDPEHKQLGHSSRHLKVTDFELMRTLGTGMDIDVLSVE
jgi:hypothetical protein